MPEAKVLQITRVMEVDQRPVAFMMDVVPEDLVDTEQLDRSFDASILKYFLAKEEGTVATSYSEIKPKLAGPRLAKSLKNPRGGNSAFLQLKSIQSQWGNRIHIPRFLLARVFQFPCFTKSRAIPLACCDITRRRLYRSSATSLASLLSIVQRE